MPIELKHEVQMGGLIHKYTGFAELRRLIDYESKKHYLIVVEYEGSMYNYIIDRKDAFNALLQLENYWKLTHDSHPIYLPFDFVDKATPRDWIDQNSVVFLESDEGDI